MERTYCVSKKCVDFMKNQLFEAGLIVHPLSEYDPEFEQMKEDHRSGTAYVFSGGECEKTVFGGDKDAQLVYRAWHDTLHIKYDLDFSQESELKVAQKIYDELLAAGCKRSAELLSWDLMLHINYYYTHNKHPTRQLDMIKAFERGDIAANAIPGIY